MIPDLPPGLSPNFEKLLPKFLEGPEEIGLLPWVSSTKGIRLPKLFFVRVRAGVRLKDYT